MLKREWTNVRGLSGEQETSLSVIREGGSTRGVNILFY